MKPLNFIVLVTFLRGFGILSCDKIADLLTFTVNDTSEIVIESIIL